MRVIDLHTHSSRSDGTDSPRQLMESAAGAGVSVLGLTDHDTTAGWAEAQRAVADTGVALVRGVEMSATFNSNSVHILGYLLRGDDPALAAHIEALRLSRRERMEAIVDDLVAAGHLDRARLEVRQETTPGRPHIADALVASGAVTDRQEAFDRFLSVGAPFYRPYLAPSMAEVIQTIHDCGGAAIWAHPMPAGRWVPTKNEIEEAIGWGLDGLEVDHRDNTDVELLEMLCRRHRILRTGSSDYHGTGKDNRLGENTTSPEVLDALTDMCDLEVVKP